MIVLFDEATDTVSHFRPFLLRASLKPKEIKEIFKEINWWDGPSWGPRAKELRAACERRGITLNL